MEAIKVMAPATVANFTVGFDVLGLALDGIGDKISLVRNDLGYSRIVKATEGIPVELNQNCVGAVLKEMQVACTDVIHVDIEIEKGFETGSGLGSSSASSAGMAVAYNRILGEPFSKEELVHFASKGEELACGSAHSDNVAPAILGGMVLVLKEPEGRCVQLPIPQNLWVVSFFPKVQVDTRLARSITPDSVSLDSATKMTSRISGFTAALFLNDMNLLKNVMKDDSIEPKRSLLIPHFEEMKRISQRLDAIGFGISGSGPSVYALVDDRSIGEKMIEEFNGLFESTGIEVSSRVSMVNEYGVKEIENEI